MYVQKGPVSMLCLVLWIGECRLRTAKGERQCTDRGPTLGTKGGPEASKRSPRGFEKDPERAQRPLSLIHISEPTRPY